MASGHVNRTNRPNTWLHRPSLRREDSSCQLGAVHTWHKADIPIIFSDVPLLGVKRALLSHCGMSAPDRMVHYSALIPAARITLPHFSVSSVISLPYSAGEPDSGVPPMSASRVLIVASARPALISRLSRSMISAGVPFGAAMPNHELASKPGTNSATVGMSGSASERLIVHTANGRSRSARIYAIDAVMVANPTWTCPPIRSAIAGPSPR